MRHEWDYVSWMQKACLALRDHSNVKNISCWNPADISELVVLIRCLHFSCTCIAVLQESEIPMSIEENSAKGEEVGTFIVTDTDKGANVDFTIVSSECSGSVSTIKDVEGWVGDYWRPVRGKMWSVECMTSVERIMKWWEECSGSVGTYRWNVEWYNIWNQNKLYSL